MAIQNWTQNIGLTFKAIKVYFKPKVPFHHKSREPPVQKFVWVAKGSFAVYINSTKIKPTWRQPLGSSDPTEWNLVEPLWQLSLGWVLQKRIVKNLPLYIWNLYQINYTFVGNRSPNCITQTSSMINKHQETHFLLNFGFPYISASQLCPHICPPSQPIVLGPWEFFSWPSILEAFQGWLGQYAGCSRTCSASLAFCRHSESSTNRFWLPKAHPQMKLKLYDHFEGLNPLWFMWNIFWFVSTARATAQAICQLSDVIEMMV